MSNCYARVIGGIGNQLFITAAAYSYSRKHNKQLIINTSSWFGGKGSKHINEYTDSIFKNFKCNSGLLPADLVSPIVETKFNYSELPYYETSVELHGYFQSLKYFEDYDEDFICKLSLPVVDTSFIKEKNVAFHIRIGDYRNFPHIFGDLTDYFNKMFKLFEDEYQINVFTDSPEIVLARYKDYKFNLIQTSSELNDLTLISQHDNVVCSNSSFSWWGSFLGKKKGLIYVPDKWLLNQDCSDIYYEGMTKYEF